jgi:histidyl-tRNA synthetase
MDFLLEIRLTDLTLKLNSVGDRECRPRYEARIREILGPHAAELCPDCRERLEKNPLRVFDCKVAACKKLVRGLPPMLESLCDACREHLGAVRGGLEACGLTYEMDPGLVRGLDYYARTAFEVHHGKLGAQSAVGGGGRYDGLFRVLGGPDVPAVGFSLGVERTLIALEEEGKGAISARPLVYLARGAGLTRDAFRLARELRRRFAVHVDFEERALGAQLRQADKLGARVALILGEEEAKAGEVTLKELATGEQRRVARSGLAAALEKQLLEGEAARSTS